MSSPQCTHVSRAIGDRFERCLICGSWRLHLYGESMAVTRRWWPVSIPMPCASDDGDIGTQYEDFQEWLEDAA